MVHTILYSFTLAASVFAQGSGYEGPEMESLNDISSREVSGSVAGSGSGLDPNSMGSLDLI
jgi:hypothetical protein